MFVFNNLFSFLSFRIEMIRFTDFLRLEMRLFCDEFESHTSDGFQFYARFVFQRCADFLDEYIQTSGSKIVFVFHSLEPAQYGFAAHHLVFVYCQQFQNLCLSCGEHFLFTILRIFQSSMVGI